MYVYFSECGFVFLSFFVGVGGDFNIMLYKYTLLFFPLVFALVGLWEEVCRGLNMVQEKNDGINKDMVLPPIQQNRPAVRALPA